MHDHATGAAALAAALDAEPPASVAALDDTLLRGLADAVQAEDRRQAAAVDAAVDDALGLVPRLLRGPVRKLIVG